MPSYLNLSNAVQYPMCIECAGFHFKTKIELLPHLRHVSVLAWCYLLRTERVRAHRGIAHASESHGRWHYHGHASASDLYLFFNFINLFQTRVHSEMKIAPLGRLKLRIQEHKKKGRGW